MAFLTLAMQGAGTGLGIWGSLFQGQVGETNALIEYGNRARGFDAQADADKFNATMTRQVAESERQRTDAEATDYRRVGKSKLASLRAKHAASGIALEGSPMIVDDSIFSEIEFGAQRIVHAGAVTGTRLMNQARLLDTSSSNNRASAIFSRQSGEYSADAHRTASYLNAGRYALSGFGEITKTLSTSRKGGWDTTPSTTWTPRVAPVSKAPSPTFGLWAGLE